MLQSVSSLSKLDQLRLTPRSNQKSEQSNNNNTALATMDLLTLNTYLRTRPLGKDIFARSDRIANSLKNQDYTVVGLQETFSGGSKHIPESLEQEGSLPYSFRQKDIRILTNSGLTTLSKYQIVEKDFKPFTYSTGSDSLAKKGIVFTRVNVPNVGNVDIYNTHLQAANSKKDSVLYKIIGKVIPGFTWSNVEIRKSQNRELIDFVNKNDVGNPTFIMGDFNMKETSAEYKDFTSRIDVKDSFRLANPDVDGGTSSGGNRIDYIFYKSGKDIDINVVSSELTHDKPIDGMMVSDHKGVHSKFELSRKN